MRLPKRGEKGFTLIELLIVVAILGVLAAVVIPNVTRFVGAGAQEAAETELHNVQLAVTSMMLENGITTIPNPLNASVIPPTAQTNHTNQMGVDPVLGGGFPDTDSIDSDLNADGILDKVTDPQGDYYEFTTAPLDKAGYLLFGHDMEADGGETVLVNYVTVETTTYYYTCEADGTVQQWDAGGLALVWD